MNLPVITVITVAYNAAADIEGTIQSVLNQTYSHIEYWVIDGDSKDDTLKIVKQYEGQLQWKSEPDKGLYDAMNKGLRLATGDFVLFLNAGDRLYENDTLEQVFSQYTPDTDVLYGMMMMVDDDRKPLGLHTELMPHELPENLTWEDMKYGMLVSHQAFIPRLAIASEYIEGNLCADLDWAIRCLKKSRRAMHTQVCIVGFQTGGLSKQRRQQSLKDRYRILAKHFGTPQNFFNHIWIVARAALFRLKNGRKSY